MKFSKETVILLSIFFISLAVYSLFIKSEFTTTNETSRIGAIESLVKSHSFVLDTSKWYTNDKIMVHGAYYSDKPPTLAFLHAGVYYMLYTFGIIDFVKDLPRALYLFIFIVIACVSSFALVIFYKLLQESGFTQWISVIMTGILAFATTFFPFSVVYNAHIVAAQLVIFSLYLIFTLEKSKKPQPFKMAFLGALIGLATSVDLLAGLFFLVAITFYIVFFSKKNIKEKACYLLGACLLLALYLVLNYSITGSLIPGALQPSLFAYQDSIFSKNNLSGFYNHASLKDLLHYALILLIGGRGLFLYTPILLLSLIGAYLYCRKNKNRALPLCLLGYLFCTILFAILFSSDHSGSSFGVRWFVPLTPVFIFFLTTYYTKIIEEKNLLQIFIFDSIATLSLLIAWIGAFFPWSHSLFSLQWNIQYIFSKFFS